MTRVYRTCEMWVGKKAVHDLTATTVLVVAAQEEVRREFLLSQSRSEQGLVVSDLSQSVND